MENISFYFHQGVCPDEISPSQNYGSHYPKLLDLYWKICYRRWNMYRILHKIWIYLQYSI